MPNKHPYELDFEQYIRNTEPAKKEKSYAWSTARLSQRRKRQ